MPIVNPPITENFQEDSWKYQATEIIRLLEADNIVLKQQVEELLKRVTALE